MNNGTAREVLLSFFVSPSFLCALCALCGYTPFSPSSTSRLRVNIPKYLANSPWVLHPLVQQGFNRTNAQTNTYSLIPMGITKGKKEFLPPANELRNESV